MKKARTIAMAVTMMLAFTGATDTHVLDFAGNLPGDGTQVSDGVREHAGRGPGSDDGHGGSPLHNPGSQVLDTSWGTDEPSAEPGWD